MPRLPLAALSLLLIAGCGASTQRGETLYRDGRFIEAAEVFEFTEGSLGESPTDVCACYGLYRGLNFLRLGDFRSARHWLAYAHALERKMPGTLDTSERALLDRGWKELEGRAVAESGTPLPETRVAASGHPAAMPRGTGPATNGKRSVRAE